MVGKLWSDKFWLYLLLARGIGVHMRICIVLCSQLPIHLSQEKQIYYFYYLDGHKGQHYPSCTIEWGWREDENWPPYKWPMANPKKQFSYQFNYHLGGHERLGPSWPTLLLMHYWVGMERRWKSVTLQMMTILQAHLKKDVNYQPTFHTKSKPIIFIIWMGMRD